MSNDRSLDTPVPESGLPTRLGRGPGGGRGGRPRRPPELVEVVAVSRLTPRLVSVTVGGADLSRFDKTAPTSHVKILVPAPDQDAPALPTVTLQGRVWPTDRPRPAMRTYTPRRFDPTAGTLDIQFVLHGSGPASEWAERAAIGDRIAVGGGPGGRFTLDPCADRWWIAGDESAVPAIGTLLDALPRSATADVHLEVGGASDEMVLTSPAQTTVHWHRRTDAHGWGAELYRAAVDAKDLAGAVVWVACEATAVRRIRRHLLAEAGLMPSSVTTRGYWRRGEADHPDHDYGEG